MIRWDANGDHIIVERPEQLALHVLPSVYRQSRFASFSRQLNVGITVHFETHIVNFFLLILSFFVFLYFLGPYLLPPCFHIFASAQIYGFMRKVNLRNVDPAIDDPDASTWCTFPLLLFFLSFSSSMFLTLGIAFFFCVHIYIYLY